MAEEREEERKREGERERERERDGMIFSIPSFCSQTKMISRLLYSRFSMCSKQIFLEFLERKPTPKDFVKKKKIKIKKN